MRDNACETAGVLLTDKRCSQTLAFLAVARCPVGLLALHRTVRWFGAPRAPSKEFLLANREFAVEPPGTTRWLIWHAVPGGYVIWWLFGCLLVMACIECLLPY
jgi:hypothetical protein